MFRRARYPVEQRGGKSSLASRRINSTGSGDLSREGRSDILQIPGRRVSGLSKRLEGCPRDRPQPSRRLNISPSVIGIAAKQARPGRPAVSSPNCESESGSRGPGQYPVPLSGWARYWPLRPVAAGFHSRPQPRRLLGGPSSLAAAPGGELGYCRPAAAAAAAGLGLMADREWQAPAAG